VVLLISVVFVFVNFGPIDMFNFERRKLFLKDEFDLKVIEKILLES
jgi:hypothetical protein